MCLHHSWLFVCDLVSDWYWLQECLKGLGFCLLFYIFEWLQFHNLTNFTTYLFYFIFFKILFLILKIKSLPWAPSRKRTISGSLTQLNKCPNCLFLFFNLFFPLVYVPFTKLKMNFRSFGENLSAQATCSRQLCVEPYLLLLNYNVAFVLSLLSYTESVEFLEGLLVGEQILGLGFLFLLTFTWMHLPPPPPSPNETSLWKRFLLSSACYALHMWPLLFPWSFVSLPAFSVLSKSKLIKTRHDLLLGFTNSVPFG